VKNEFGDGDYHPVFGPEGGLKRPYTAEDFLSFDGRDEHAGEHYSSTAGPLARYPYVDYSTVAYSTPKPTVPAKSSAPATAASKVFIPHGPHHYHHPKHHFVHDVVGHYISDVAGHKIRHVGEVLESGALNEPIIHKLKFAKAALLPLVAIVGSLSAINGVHFVAKASDPHAYEHGHAAAGAGAAAPDHDEGFGHAHHPNTLVGLIYHVVAQLSKFNTAAKVHFVPNLLRIVSKTSSSSAHASGHHGRRR